MTLSIFDEAQLRAVLPTPVERRAIREAAEVSQGAVADELGVTRQAVSLWEAGLREPAAEHLEAYVALLVRLADIVGKRSTAPKRRGVSTLLALPVLVLFLAGHMTISDLLERGDTCTVEEAAEVLHCSRGSAYNAVRAGEIPAIHLGARWLVPVRRLAALLGVDLEESQ